jgi:integrase
MVEKLRKAPGMRERSHGVWELIVESGRDPVTGKRRQVSRVFRGNMRDATKARAALLTEAAKGRHTGSGASVDELFSEWIRELERKGRSPNTIHNYEKTYRRNIQPTLGKKAVTKVTQKMLTDLYGAHQKRGLKPRSIYQIHATLSSMFTQACRWGWRDSNPAQWAETPAATNEAPVIPTPEEVMQLIAAAHASRRPDKARAIFVSATTGMRRAEICALKRDRDIDWERNVINVSRSIVALRGEPAREIPTKNRRARQVAIDDATMRMLREQVELIESRASLAGVELIEDPYIFSDEADGAMPWKPDSLTQYFVRLRDREGLSNIDFHSLRKFMETYAQDLGFSTAQVAIRAGHDPSVMARHYTGRIEEADRALASAVAALITEGG